MAHLQGEDEVGGHRLKPAVPYKPDLLNFNLKPINNSCIHRLCVPLRPLGTYYKRIDQF